SERGELNRLPDRNAGQHCEQSNPWKNEVNAALQRIVFSLNWMIAPREEIELHHLPRVSEVSAPRNKITPFAVQIHKRDVDQAIHHEHPHHSEMPVSCAAKPCAESQLRRNGVTFPWITAESFALARKPWICVEYPEPAPDHDRERDKVDPVCDANDPVVSQSRHETTTR